MGQQKPGRLSYTTRLIILRRLNPVPQIVARQTFGPPDGYVGVDRLRIKIGGKIVTRDVTLGSRSVSVLAHDSRQNKIVLVEEMAAGLIARGILHRFFGLISGGLNNGESPEQAGMRELDEETGLPAISTKIIQRLAPVAPTVSTHYASMIYARVDLEGWKGNGKPRQDGDGRIIPRVVTTAQFMKHCDESPLVSQGMITAANWLRSNMLWLGLACGRKK